MTSLLLSVAGVATCWCSSTGSYVISRASETFSPLRWAGDYTQPPANVYSTCLRFSVRCSRVASGSFHPWCRHPPRKPCRPRRRAWRRMSPPEGSSRSGPLGVARRRVSALTGAPLRRRRACDLRCLTLWLGGQSGLACIIPAPAAAAAAGTRPAHGYGPKAVHARPGHRTRARSRRSVPPSHAAAGSCQPVASIAGDALTAARWALQLIAWALAALFIAGFTLIVWKT